MGEQETQSEDEEYFTKEEQPEEYEEYLEIERDLRNE